VKEIVVYYKCTAANLKGEQLVPDLAVNAATGDNPLLCTSVSCIAGTNVFTTNSRILVIRIKTDSEV